MSDYATSSDPAVQRQLDRLWSLSPGADTLGLERITRLLDRLGDPQHRLPPVLHVAGTNGKGSTCAFLRAAIDAAGLAAHVYSSPHLVRFNERIRVAGTLIDDGALAALLEEVLDHAGGLDASFFEVTTAVAFLAFARNPADACVVEVGLGGRLDATNVIQHPLVTGIAQLGIDHQAFLGDSAEGIAAEKAGIAKAGVPLVTMRYADGVASRIAEVAAAAAAPVKALGVDWFYEVRGDRLDYRDAQGALDTPLPGLPGPHQPGNLALAIAMLRHQTQLAIPTTAIETAARCANWPARMQRLADGPLTRRLPAASALWLDGGHNQAAGAAVATAIADLRGDRPLHLVCGMLANKDAAGFLAPLARQASSLTAVPIPGHACHPPAALARTAAALGLETNVADTVGDALRRIADRHDATDPVVLIVGSLYLAGEVLATNGELPN
ncbi:dihydrofolate synthase/folylpolyglutamate synthase [Hephaestia caeni]|uniref:Dihydrofolate synthase/folylpolyglutamate synthase n=1 Tax=Hephaestia caeni TaxID=645617 RepID=A0A397NGJ7_9SPHN|nr:folylpolyglutamate synthase/dihydrofolate synthase family protein [Hephaestia caeni]RIA36646.1 dihydrofolate synthase/folylpolyglutamate synthase [Hephaestia caeni]